ncbi:glycosyltransferase family 2 protein [Psychromonas sp. L1A2]|uniref:glycosyltransferase family 2 protein n=1 Tax=Psychromonas sp. L1A2 TaxID=2686356 RepID=UPI001359EAF3|nr:glycosyltransferase family 2 protein [Psychromonas sp. L1A2]
MASSDIISIIMPSFNSEAVIAESINSVLIQTYSDFELIITDDNSTDNTIAIIRQYQGSDRRIKLFTLGENLGAGNARNNSIKHAKGRFIAFLDADDIWLPTKLEKQIKFMLDNRYTLTYSAYQKFDRDGDLGIINPPLEVSYNQLLYSNVIGCLTAIYDTKYIGKQYMPLIRKRQDMGLWLTILKMVPKAYCLNEVLAKYRVDSGMTQDKLLVLKYQWQFYREVVGLNVFKAFKVFIIYAIKGYLKSFK